MVAYFALQICNVVAVFFDGEEAPLLFHSLPKKFLQESWQLGFSRSSTEIDINYCLLFFMIKFDFMGVMVYNNSKKVLLN